MTSSNKKHFVLVDIDGTIADTTHRLHHIQKEPKDWNSFFMSCDADTPIKPIIQLVQELHDNGAAIIFCTGRDEKCRNLTFGWLMRYFSERLMFNATILMRRTNDRRHDTIVKPELLATAGIELDTIRLVLEDRNSMVDRWRELGLTCLQVANGNF